MPSLKDSLKKSLTGYAPVSRCWCIRPVSDLISPSGWFYHSHMDYQSLRNREFETTLRVLQAFPLDKSDLRPADKCRTARELATVFVVEERVNTQLLETGATNPQALNRKVPETMAGIISAWQEAVAASNALIARTSQEQMAKIVDFYGMKIPLSEALWFELLDHIHHRGQFSVYLRMAGGVAPSIYGPTAEVQG